MLLAVLVLELLNAKIAAILNFATGNDTFLLPVAQKIFLARALTVPIMLHEKFQRSSSISKFVDIPEAELRSLPVAGYTPKTIGFMAIVWSTL